MCADLGATASLSATRLTPLGPLMRVERAQAARGQGKGGGLRDIFLPGAVYVRMSVHSRER